MTKKKLTKPDLIELKTLADALVKTLGSMSPEQADKIVKEVAYTIYIDILGKKGRIVKTQDIYACGARFDNNNGNHFFEYEFVEDSQE